MQILPPQQADYGFYNTYMDKAPKTDLLTALQENWEQIRELGNSIPEEASGYAYAPGKWTIKETFLHLVDAERNFCYRIMRISRNDQAALPMYNVHDFAINGHAAYRTMDSILSELELLRKATILMFRDMHPEMLDRTGPARDVVVSVKALGYIMAGHTVHHMQILKERYLQPA